MAASEKRAKLEEERLETQQRIMKKREHTSSARVEKLRMRIADLESHCAHQGITVTMNEGKSVALLANSREELEKEWRVEFRRSWDQERKKKLKELEKRFSRSFKKQLASTLKKSIGSASPSPTRRSPVMRSPPRSARMPDPKLSMSISTASILDDAGGDKRYDALDWELDLEDSTPPYMFTSKALIENPAAVTPSRTARRTLDFSRSGKSRSRSSKSKRKTARSDRYAYADINLDRTFDQDSWLCEIGERDPLRDFQYLR